MNFLLSLLFSLCFVFCASLSAGFAAVTTVSASKTLRISISDKTTGKSETVINFKKGYSELYQAADGDAPHAGAGSVTVTSLTSDNKSMAINFMPELTEVNEIKISVSSRASQNVVLTFSELPLAENYKLILKDKLLNTTKTLSQGCSYEFAIDRSDKSTYGSSRFSVVVEKAIDIIPDYVPPPQKTIEKPFLSVYPNPASRELFVDSNIPYNTLEVSIYNSSGVLVKKTTIDRSASISVSDLEVQPYVLVLKEHNKQLLVTKFLKE